MIIKILDEIYWFVSSYWYLVLIFVYAVCYWYFDLRARDQKRVEVIELIVRYPKESVPSKRPDLKLIKSENADILK